MATSWRLAKPARIAAALRVAQSRNSGGWFVAGRSVDVGRRESVTRTIAYSNRTGLQVARWLSPLIRPGIRHTARKLWVDDLAYAERRYELRQRGEFPG
jgi:hypothetical protein